MTTRVPKPRLPASERRELIVDAAMGEFAQRGYEAASMGRIAEAAGISRTVLYDHFPSKHALFVELLRTQHAALLSYLSKPLAAQGTMRQRMQGTFDAFFAFAQERPQAWQLLFPDHPPVDVIVAVEHRRCRTESNRLLAELLEPDARATGIDPDSPVGHMVFTIHQEALHGAVRWWHSHPEVPRAELVRAVMAALWTGMGAVERGESWVDAD